MTSLYYLMFYESFLSILIIEIYMMTPLLLVIFQLKLCFWWDKNSSNQEINVSQRSDTNQLLLCICSMRKISISRTMSYVWSRQNIHKKSMLRESIKLFLRRIKAKESESKFLKRVANSLNVYGREWLWTWELEQDWMFS